ncbi:Lipopolysaccharide-assembly [Aquimarina amphilecti]|uniref:Lipopolysaccharide-assembly n=1 Tax=Aquimarina amphilecti TaxID=1038014 RepID=A0A1H7RYK9_AQUAM|nr:LptE family protein [Aquimarina amphilecti]SEL65411.1 Lipopolysaccharide-assembly [Aquimarina amphilecti]
MVHKIKYTIIAIIGIIIIQGCGAYSFSGINTTATTFQVGFFQNQASIIIPGIDQTFTNQLQDLILNQTNLDLVTSNGDIAYEGEIVQYYVAPTNATSANTAAQNRLTIAVNVRFYDIKNPKEDLEQRFSFFFDYPASQAETAVRDEAVQIIYDRITQDILNATLAKW